MTTVFKVVRRRKDGKLTSAVMRHRKMMCLYESGTPTLALNGMKLFAFFGADDAERFSRCFPIPVEVWEAEAENPRPLAEIGLWWWGLRHIRDFWAGNLPRTKMLKAMNGTVACDSITLIKRVDEAVD